MNEVIIAQFVCVNSSSCPDVFSERFTIESRVVVIGKYFLYGPI